MDDKSKSSSSGTHRHELKPSEVRAWMRETQAQLRKISYRVWWICFIMELPFILFLIVVGAFVVLGKLEARP